jgi:hydrogenase maturation protein HypF
VILEVEGGRGNIEGFLQELQSSPPPCSHIEELSVEEIAPPGFEGFEIRQSKVISGEYQLISPDIATCNKCQEEILHPADRRYRYPFTNCTNCGPRFTIIEDIPYDRPRTTMRDFVMCPDCQREYDDCSDRRFHAQPNACPVCGPQLSLLDDQGNNLHTLDAISEAARLLRRGNIVALKGLGGFLLACDALNEGAVRTLRRRKRRPHKPLAVMMEDIEEVKRHCSLCLKEKEALLSPQCPIILLRWKNSSPIPKLVAPNTHYLGVMLPYTPLHHLLLRDVKRPLVMTSGNLSEEPIAKDNDEACEKLSGIADYFLVHNRDIRTCFDDSVAQVELGKLQLIRRARGYAPYPVHLPFRSREVLGVGGDLKNTFCLLKDEYAFLSQHIGDMESTDSLAHLEDTLGLYRRLFRVKPEVIACDLHPDYTSTRYARRIAQEEGLPLVPVQHHHAHIVSCLTDNQEKGPVIGVAFDGTGYGSDGLIWGGEFMLSDLEGFQRLGHLQYLPLPGGDMAIRKPYRTAIGYLSYLGYDIDLPFLDGVDSQEVSLIRKQVERGINCPLTSSIGRLFDAVSALLGIRGRATFEGQAASDLEMMAGNRKENTYPFSIVEDDEGKIILVGELVEGIISGLKSSLPPSRISARFHATVALMISRMCQILHQKTGITKVALSGGVFQNRLLLKKTVFNLEAQGFTVLSSGQIPPGDGGISVGQAVIASLGRG